MPNDKSNSTFHSVLAPLMEAFVEEKRACGYRYNVGDYNLGRLDEHLCTEGLTTIDLPRSMAKKWLSKRAHESARTQQVRITILRQFSKYLVRHGYSAYVPDSTLSSRSIPHFVPRILTLEEIQRVLQAADQLIPTARSPLKHLIMPEIFRLLYGCGFRLGEVLKLRVRDVDLDQGILIVREGKFRKDRLVPPSLSLVKRLRKYASIMGVRLPDAAFFPAPSGRPYSIYTIYSQFRILLHQSRISHGGRGKGPRVHDLRHGFAVHTLLRWCREGADLNAKLPLLATYLGHKNLSGTQRYLHLTAELFPEILKRTEAAFGDVIPWRTEP